MQTRAQQVELRNTPLPSLPNLAHWQMGFYAGCIEFVWLFWPAQCQQQTVTFKPSDVSGSHRKRKNSIGAEGSSYCCFVTYKQSYCIAAPQTQTDWHTDIYPAPTSQREAELICAQAHDMTGEVCLSSLFIKYNIQQQAEATQEQHLSTGSFAARWNGKQELYPLWCCWGKSVTRPILSRMSAFSPLSCNSIPVLNRDLRLHRPTCSLSN